jgi:hypothetical protein
MENGTVSLLSVFQIWYRLLANKTEEDKGESLPIQEIIVQTKLVV